MVSFSRNRGLLLKMAIIFWTIPIISFAQNSPFKTPVELNDGKATNIIDVKHVDMDMDGELDLVTASATEIRWYKGKGGGEFENSELLIDVKLSGKYSELRTFDVGDIDGDGDMDIVYADISDIIAYENDGDLNMSELSTWMYGRVKQIFLTSKLVDGKPEIITISEEAGTSFHTLTENGELTDSHSISGDREKAIYTDLDGNNEKDLVVLQKGYAGEQEHFAGVYWGANSSMEDIEHNFIIPELDIQGIDLSITDATVADMNSDGFNDIVFSINGSTNYNGIDLNNGYLVYLENNGNTGFKAPVLSDQSTPGFSSLIATDSEANEPPQIVASQINDEYTTGDIKAISFDTTSGFNTPEDLIDDNYYFDKLYSYDIDGDSLQDIVASSSFGDLFGWFRKKADGNLEEFRLIGESFIPSPKDIAELDVDSDGANDLIVASSYPNKALSWYKNSGNYKFEQGGIIEQDLVNVKEIKIGDLNSDGAPDIILRTENFLNSEHETKTRQHEFWWYQNLQNGSFSEKTYIGRDTSSNGHFSIVDYNDDNKPDIAFSSIKVSMFLNNEIGENFAKSGIENKEGPIGGFSVSGDINGDSKDELITISLKDSINYEGPFPNIKTYYEVTASNEDTVYSKNLHLEKRADNFSAVKAFDLNNDETEEVVFTSNPNYHSMPVSSLYLLDFADSGEISVQLVDSSYAGFTNLTVGDFTDDGIPDLVATENTYSNYLLDYPYKWGGGIILYQNDGDLSFRKTIQPDSLRIDVSGLRTVNLGTSSTSEVLSFSAEKDWVIIYPSFETLPVSTVSGPYVPQSFSLSQNYPNPFNPSTTINYSIPAAGKVELKVYNLLGQLVQTLVDDRKSAGMHQVRFDASVFASGVYIYRLKAADKVQTRKMILIK